VPPDADLRLMVHQLDKSLAGHLAECAQQNKQLWIEIRAFKRILWTCFGAGCAACCSLIAFLAQRALHL
jgi:hypothetical protein